MSHLKWILLLVCVLYTLWPLLSPGHNDGSEKEGSS
jgi:hypothetical protein